ncbi:MAG: hypothetical protein IJH84_01420 [Saccharopolyspora sp.]|uniref:hypothetical protein n=1 Tax=Saccharopolyspora sp. TaxID=33915 RepID=UPI0025DC5343|nr:hypothetical protein [Saccharopolyspora sp.]MBQ6639673.1 hypothetical protein [Saccharopolyspora sp.]
MSDEDGHRRRTGSAARANSRETGTTTAFPRLTRPNAEFEIVSGLIERDLSTTDH